MNKPPEYVPNKDPKAENQRQERYLWYQDVLYLIGEDVEKKNGFRTLLKKHLDKIYKV